MKLSSILKTTTTTTTTTTSTTLLGPAFVLSWSQPPIRLKPANGKEEARPKQRVRFSTNVRVRQYCIDKKNHMNPADIKQLREKPLDKNQRHQPSLNRDEEEASQQRDGPSKQQSQQPPTPTTTTETPRVVHDSREHAPSQEPSLRSALPETSPMRLGERVETSILTTAPEPATGVATITAEANSPAMAVSSTEESPFDKDAFHGIEVFVPHGLKWKRKMEHPFTHSRKRRKTDDSGAFESVEESPVDFICRGGSVSLPVCAPTFLSQQSQQHDRKRERDEPAAGNLQRKRQRISNFFMPNYINVESPALVEESPFDVNASNGIDVFISHGGRLKRQQEHPITRSRKRRKSGIFGSYETIAVSSFDFVCGRLSLPVVHGVQQSENEQSLDTVLFGAEQSENQTSDLVLGADDGAVLGTEEGPEEDADDGLLSLDTEEAVLSLLFGAEQSENQTSDSVVGADDGAALGTEEGPVPSSSGFSLGAEMGAVLGTRGDSSLGAELGAVLGTRDSLLGAELGAVLGTKDFSLSVDDEGAVLGNSDSTLGAEDGPVLGTSDSEVGGSCKRKRDEPADKLPPQKRRRIYTTAAADAARLSARRSALRAAARVSSASRRAVLETIREDDGEENEDYFVANDGDESAWQQLLFGEAEDEDSADFFNAEDSEAMFLLLFGDHDNLDGSLLSRDNCEEEDMLALLFGNEGDSELGAELGAVLVPRRAARRAAAPVSSAPRRSARIAAHRTATAVAPAAPEEYRRPAHLRQIPRVCYKGMC